MNWREAPATVAIAGLTLIVSAVLLLSGWLSVVAVWGGFIPLRAAGSVGSAVSLPVWLTPLSATLIHASVAHIALNLVMLVFCGAATERAIGSGSFAFLYVIGAYAAAAVQWAIAPASPVPMIGASGAISAIVGAYALLYGERRARRIGPVPADIAHVAWLAAAWIGIQLLIGVAGLGGGAPIAIGAHIGGFLAGLLLIRPLLLWRYRKA